MTQNITITYLHGVGVNSVYAIALDGVQVAVLHRSGSRDRFAIYSAHYSEPLGHYRNAADAKAAALTLNYPDAWQVYEAISQRVERDRRRWMEQDRHDKLVELARDLAAGSNSARERAVELVAEIETFAKDRTQTSNFWYSTNSRSADYPEPPKQAKPVAA